MPLMQTNRIQERVINLEKKHGAWGDGGNAGKNADENVMSMEMALAFLHSLETDSAMHLGGCGPAMASFVIASILPSSPISNTPDRSEKSPARQANRRGTDNRTVESRIRISVLKISI